MGLIKWHFVGLLPESADWRFARNTVAIPFLGALFAFAVAGTTAWDAGLSFVDAVWLSTRAFALAYLGILIPFAFSRLVAVALLPRFERGLRTVLSLSIFILLFTLNICVTLASNPTSPARVRALDGLFSAGPSLFQAITLLLEGALVLAALYRLARDPVTHHALPGRLIAALAVVVLFLTGDWWMTRARWTIAPENQSPDARHELTIVVPELDPNGLKVALTDSRLTDWKEHTRFFAEIIPTTHSQVGELVTFVSGLQPWEHGLRDETLRPDDDAMLHDFLLKRFGERGELIHNRVLGATVPVASFFDRNASTPCSKSEANAVAVAAFSWLLPLYAQIPERMAAQLVPAYSCSHALAPLATLAEQALTQFASEFNRPIRARSLWLLNLPKRWGDDDLSRLQSLSDSLLRFKEILEILGLERNTRITIAGLGGSRGSIAVISDFDVPALRVTSPSALHIGTAQAAAILKGVLPARETFFYAEEISRSPKPRPSSQLASDVFLAQRTLRCAWKDAGAQIVTLFHLKPNHAGIETSSEEWGGIEILSPVLTSRAECVTAARQAFDAIIARDVSLLDSRPLEALLRRHLIETAWAPSPPPAAPTLAPVLPTPGAMHP